jgi:NADH dehydrogenase
MKSGKRKHVIVVGGGFGGMQATKARAKSDVDITLVDRRNFHLFQPLLYQVATGGLSPANIAAPIRSIFRRQKNVLVALGDLVVAAGAISNYFGSDQFSRLAPGLKTIEDATEIRKRVLSAFEAAEIERDANRKKRLLTFVVVGAGPTGVELAGAIAELARHTLLHDFRNIAPEESRVIIVDGGERVLNSFSQSLSAKAQRFLKDLKIELEFEKRVTDIQPNFVVIEQDQQQTTIETETVLWAAGVAGVPLGKKIADAANVQCSRDGRVPVQRSLNVKGFPNLFVIGDLAQCKNENGSDLPGVAPVAISQGNYVGKRIDDEVRGELREANTEPFVYRDLGQLATIGRSAAIADLGKIEFAGFFAWLLWLFIHILTLAKFQNRVLVFFQWASNYLTFNRSARLISQTESDTDIQDENNI